MLTPIAIKCTVRDVICIGRKRKSNHSEGCTDLNDPFDFQIYFSVEKSHPWQWMAEIAFKHISGITQYNVNTKILFLMVTYNLQPHSSSTQQTVPGNCTMMYTGYLEDGQHKKQPYLLGFLFLLLKFLFVKTKLVNEVWGHLLQLVIREGLMNKPGNHVQSCLLKD